MKWERQGRREEVWEEEEDKEEEECWRVTLAETSGGSTAPILLMKKNH